MSLATTVIVLAAASEPLAVVVKPTFHVTLVAFSACVEPAKVTFVTLFAVTIEPGLKIMAEDGWSPGEDPAALLEKIRAAMGALEANTEDRNP